MYRYKSTNTNATRALHSLYLLYWYKSTNTDATHLIARPVGAPRNARVSCKFYKYKSTNTDAFTSTKVQILTLRARQTRRRPPDRTCWRQKAWLSRCQYLYFCTSKASTLVRSAFQGERTCWRQKGWPSRWRAFR